MTMRWDGGATARALRGAATAALCLLAAVGLAGCGITDWFGGDEERLEGERIDVLGPERQLEPSAEIAGREVRLPRPERNAVWAQPGGAADHAPGHLALGDAPKEVWRADVGDASGDREQITGQPVVAGDRVYALDAGATVTAFDADSGARVWRRDLAEDEDGIFGGGVAVADGRVFVTTGLGVLFALDAASGETVWRRNVGAPMRAGPTVHGGRVYAISIVNETVAHDAETGEELWTHQGIEEQAGLLGSASPAASGSAVIVAYSSGELFGLLAENGRALWSDSLAGIARTQSVADLTDVRGKPVVQDNRVYAISNANRMAAVDMRRGARVWEKALSGIEMPWLAGGWLFLVTSRSEVLALDRERGRIRWVAQLARWEDPDDKDGPIVWQGPVLAGDRLVLLGSHGKAVSVSPYTGEVLGAMDLPGRPAAPPAVADATLYIVTDGGTLVAYR
jgi:outer membrane protein assembly factor BamB